MQSERKDIGLWFRIPQARPSAARRLFVFHHAGGSAAAYARWSRDLPADVELAVLELPGRGARHREPLLGDFKAALDGMDEGIRALLDRPFIFFGHSLGALLAFELARRIEARAAPEVLGLSAFLPPTSPNLAGREKIAHLPDIEFVAKLERYAPLPAEILGDPEALRFFLPVIRQDVRLIESYTHADFARRPLPMLAFAGDRDPSAEAGRMAEWDRFGLLRGTVLVRPGHHFYLFDHHREILARLLVPEAA